MRRRQLTRGTGVIAEIIWLLLLLQLLILLVVVVVHMRHWRGWVISRPWGGCLSTNLQLSTLMHTRDRRGHEIRCDANYFCPYLHCGR